MWDYHYSTVCIFSHDKYDIRRLYHRAVIFFVCRRHDVGQNVFPFLPFSVKAPRNKFRITYFEWDIILFTGCSIARHRSYVGLIAQTKVDTKNSINHLVKIVVEKNTWPCKKILIWTNDRRCRRRQRIDWSRRWTNYVRFTIGGL